MQWALNFSLGAGSQFQGLFKKPSRRNGTALLIVPFKINSYVPLYNVPGAGSFTLVKDPGSYPLVRNNLLVCCTRVAIFKRTIP
jgi:hypothetical protein